MLSLTTQRSCEPLSRKDLFLQRFEKYIEYYRERATSTLTQRCASRPDLTLPLALACSRADERLTRL